MRHTSRILLASVCIAAGSFGQQPSTGTQPRAHRWVAHFTRRPFNLDALRTELWGRKDPEAVENIVTDLERRVKRHQAEFVADVRSLGGKIHHQFWLVNCCAFEIAPRHIATIRSLPNVASVQPDLIYAPAIKTATDSRHHQADQLQARGITGTGAAIAILDSGHDENMNGSGKPHVIYTDRFGRSRLVNFKIGSQSKDDVHGHGTAVASVAAGWKWRTSGADYGFAYGSTIAGYAIADFPNGNSYSSTMARAWESAVRSRATFKIAVGNLSYGGSNNFLSVEQKAMDAAAVVGDILCCTAAGNSGTNISGSQANLNGLSVGACDKSFRLAGFSSRGLMGGSARPRVFPTICATGVSVVMAKRDNESADLVADGTSMASPMVAGLAAQLRARYTALKSDETKAILLASTWPMPGTGGNLNVGPGAGYLWGGSADNVAATPGKHGRGLIANSQRVWRRTVQVRQGARYQFAIAWHRQNVDNPNFTDLQLQLKRGNQVVASSLSGWSTEEFIRYTATRNETLTLVVSLWRFHGGESRQEFGWASNAVTNRCEPTIVRQPRSVTVCQNERRELVSVQATSVTNYQWYRNGSRLPNETRPSIVATVTPGHGGVYYCVLSNSCSSVRTISARVTVSTCRITQFDPASGLNGFGHDVENLGDVDGDGYNDVGVYESRYYNNGQPRFWVFSGRTTSRIAQWHGTSSSGRLFKGGGGNMVGGDVNGDGYSDVLYGDPGYISRRGYLGWYSGKERKWREVHFGATGTELGTCIELAHLDNDSKLDLLAVASDRIYAYSSRNPNTYWTRLWNVRPIAGVRVHSMSRVGDVNGDGVDDFVIGLPNDRSNTGRWQLRSGRNGALLGQAPGRTAGWSHGHSVAGVGDANGDGVRDFVVGAPGQGANAGLVQLLSGKHFGSVLIKQYVGRTASRRLGFTVAGTTIDSNGDGVPEILASEIPTSTSAKGKVCILHGRTLAKIGVRQPQTARQYFGYAIAGLDTNGDSRLDLLVGQPTNAAFLYDAVPRVNPPRIEIFGSSCPDSQGRLTRIGVGGVPRVGGSYRWTVRAKPNTPVIFEYGISRQNFDLTPIGMPGCRWYVAPFLILPFATNSSGHAELTLPIPNDGGFTGTRWVAQWFPIDTALKTPLTIAASNAGEVRIGAK